MPHRFPNTPIKTEGPSPSPKTLTELPRDTAHASRLGRQRRGCVLLAAERRRDTLRSSTLEAPTGSQPRAPYANNRAYLVTRLEWTPAPSATAHYEPSDLWSENVPARMPDLRQWQMRRCGRRLALRACCAPKSKARQLHTNAHLNMIAARPTSEPLTECAGLSRLYTPLHAPAMNNLAV